MKRVVDQERAGAPRGARRLSRALVFVLLVAFGAVAIAQPDPWGAPPSGSGTPSPTPDPSPGSGGTMDPSPGSGTAPSPGSGTAPSPGSGAAPDPGSGAPTPGSGATPPSTGSGAAGSAAGSGSGTGPRIIQVPTDLNAPTVSAAASPTVVRLGNKFTVFITATFAAGVEVNLREPLELGPAFEITRRITEPDKPTGDGRTQREWQLEVIAWELGELSMPGIAVTYTTMGKADQVTTNGVKLRVEGVLGDVVDDPKAMRNNAPPADLLSRDWFLLYVAIGGAIGLALLIGLIAWVRGRKRRIAMVGGVIAVPRKFDSASDRALHQLKEIEDSGILDRDEDRKKGYGQMVEVIRQYLGSRYRVATFDLTTSELMKRLAKVASDDECDLIERWLERCDIVKYGGLKATAVDAAQTLEAARQLVVTTTQMPAKSEAKREAKTEPPKPEPPAPQQPPIAKPPTSDPTTSPTSGPPISALDLDPSSPRPSGPSDPSSPEPSPGPSGSYGSAGSSGDPSPWAPPSRPSSPDDDAATKPFEKPEEGAV
jgi:hypothetical protein